MLKYLKMMIFCTKIPKNVDFWRSFRSTKVFKIYAILQEILQLNLAPTGRNLENNTLISGMQMNANTQLVNWF